MRGPVTEIIAGMDHGTKIRAGWLSSRRKLALLGAAVVIAAVMMVQSSRHALRHDRGDVILLYVGAEDCAPCRAWRKGDGAAFLASEEFARITYREVRSQHLEDVLNDDNWPDDVRDYRSRIRRSDGVPLWIVIADRVVVEQQFGAAAWQSRVLPAVKSWLR